MRGGLPELMKVTIGFEPVDYHFAQKRSTDLFGRRGFSLYIRKLVRLDRQRIEADAAEEQEAPKP